SCANQSRSLWPPPARPPGTDGAAACETGTDARSAPSSEACSGMTRASPAGRGRMPSGRLARAAERLAIGVASLALSVGLIAVLSGFFAGRDKAGVSGPASVPGQSFRDLGAATLQPG